MANCALGSNLTLNEMHEIPTDGESFGRQHIHLQKLVPWEALFYLGFEVQGCFSHCARRPQTKTQTPSPLSLINSSLPA